MKNTNDKLALALFLLIVALVVSGGFRNPLVKYPVAASGTLDLREWDLEYKGVTELRGDWNFYWMKLVTPQELAKAALVEQDSYITLPSSWTANNMQGQPIPPDGYATLQLQVKLQKQHELLALKMPTIFTAYKIWINGKLTDGMGIVGTSPLDMTPRCVPQVVVFKPETDTVDIVIQVSNFMHRESGIKDPIKIGTEKQIRAEAEKKVAFDMFLFGAFMITSIYHLNLFAYRRQEQSHLYFGLVCFLLCIRSLVLGEHLLAQMLPMLPWEFTTKLEFLTYYVMQPLFILFLHSMFPQEIPQKLCRVYNWIGGIFGIMVIAAPAYIYSNWLWLYHIGTVIALILLGYYIFLAFLHKREGAFLTIIGSIILIFTAMGDILYFNGIYWINDFFNTDSLSSFGLLTFVFLQSCNLSRNFSIAFTKIEEMSLEMRHLNENLEAMVQERTAALEDVSHQVQLQKAKLEEANYILEQLSRLDGLTNIANRRYFDEVIKSQWERSVAEQSFLAIILIDIDFFKGYNDHYGHQAGDECLIKVARTLKESFRHERDLVARYGGEEFVAVLPNTPPDMAGMLAERVRGKIEDLQIPHAYSTISQYLTISLGVAVVVANSQISFKDLIQQADTALYQAKNEGRNQHKLVVLPTSFTEEKNL